MDVRPEGTRNASERRGSFDRINGIAGMGSRGTPEQSLRSLSS
jgi:hypothetical protein